MVEKVTTEQQGRVRILRINRPEKHNAVDGEVAVGLGRSISDFANDPDSRVLIVTGAGESFCAGADLKNPEGLLNHEYVDQAGPMGFARLDPGKPTIAAVNGFCFAGGLELATWCDFRVAAADAEFGCLSRRWGVPYTDGGTQRLARILGTGGALYLLMSGVRVNAEHALRMGLVQEVVPKGRALGRALELAQTIADYPNFEGIKADRQALLSGWGLPLDDALLLEARVVRPTLSDPEMAQGLERFGGGARDRSPTPPEA